MKKLIKAIWNTTIDIKDDVMVRVWAFFHERAYRHKAAKYLAIGCTAFAFLCDTFIINGSKLSIFGILMLVLFATLSGAFAIEYLKGREKDA